MERADINELKNKKRILEIQIYNVRMSRYSALERNQMHEVYSLSRTLNRLREQMDLINKSLRGY